MAYISRMDCVKTVVHALLATNLHHVILNINGPELMFISHFVEIDDGTTGNHVTYLAIADEENYQVFDVMGVPRTIDGVFPDGA